jgi:tetratricopeptide (TPR) repeat protein
MVRTSFYAADGVLRSLDRLVTGGLILLILLTPIAIGAVRRDACITMEIGIFLLIMLWMVRLLAGGMRPARGSALAREGVRLSIPVFATAVLLFIQLIPLPPRILHLLSPTTYRVYQIALPDWPYEGLYHALQARWRGAPVPKWFSPSMLPPVESARSRQVSAGSHHPVETEPGPVGFGRFRWRTLSLAPSVTFASLIEFVAVGGAFLLVLLYPFGLIGEREAQVRFLRTMVYVVVATAALIALLGIAERTWWNGKILWFFVPTDWNGPLLIDSPRASGPFVDPDHFANYLAMVLPLAVSGALFPFSIIPRRQRPNAQMFFAAAVVLLLTGIVLSLSRGGLIATAVGVTTALLLCFTRARDRALAALQRLGFRAMPLSIATFALMMLLIVYLIGAPARSEVGDRLAKSRSNDLGARVTAWDETLPLIADFPLLGAGLGTWPEIFPHYQSPPQSRYFFFRAAENDYLQFVAETGFAGLLCLLIFAGLVIRVMAGRARAMLSRRWPLFAGLLGGIGAGLMHEAVDFGFHIPANALLFTIMLSLALRVALNDIGGREFTGLKTAEAAANRSLLPLLAASLPLLMIVAAFRQDGHAYPYDLGHPANFESAERDVMSHPAMAITHLALARMMPLSAHELQSNQLQAASWLDPNGALARDLYARNLLLSGEKKQALEQISLSVYRAPYLDVHYYLAPSAIPWLLPDEQQAIARGFFLAVAQNFEFAADELASFFDQLGRYSEAGDAYARAARATSDEMQRFDFLLKAGRNYARASQYAEAVRVLQEASKIDSEDPRPYSELAENVYSPQNKLAAANAAVTTGIEHGGDPYTLEMAEANAAEKVGNHPAAEEALIRALRYAPSFDAMLSLGRVYFEENRFERAVATLQQATEINPDSAEAFDWLGRADEADYDYYAADRAYARAMTLAPTDAVMHENYLDFQRRTAASAGQANEPAK